MLVAICPRAARCTRDHILRSDATGERFKEALIEARAGVRVRLLFDSVGSLRRC